MFNKYFEKREKQKTIYKRCFEKGVEMGRKFKSRDLAKIKSKYELELQELKSAVKKMNKKVTSIEAEHERYEEIINRTTSVIKNIHNNSYAKNMVANTEHKSIKALNSEMELIGIGAKKIRAKLDEKVIDYKRTDVVLECP